MTFKARLDVDDLKEMVQRARTSIERNEGLLGRLDGAIGDGDHGTSMRKAMTLVSEAVAGAHPVTGSDLFEGAAMAFLKVDGGATGPLFGSFFLGLADGANELTTFGATEVADLLEGGLKRLETRTKAQVGDKTLMDALIPAVEKVRNAASSGSGVADALDRAASAAEEGAESTSALRARFGRSKHQGERAIGHRDPGAVSMALIIRAFADVANERSNTDEQGKERGHA